MNHNTNGTAGEPTFLVVTNDEQQYSIWPSYRALPAGWQAARSEPAPKQDCLDYIEAHWTDMRPRSLRDQVA